jgi:uncharacterized SAM-binding protein YcdF (DUF218 family)
MAFYLLSRVAKFFLSPENQAYACALALLPWIAGRGGQRGRIIGQLSAIWLVVLFSPLASVGLYYYERGTPIPPLDSLRGKTGLVLGGNTVLYDESVGQMNWFGDSGRVHEPVRLYRAGLLKRLVLSATPGGEGTAISDWWQEMGVPITAITVEDTARNTRENFTRSRGLLKPDEPIVLITSAYHMRRSLAVARRTIPNPVTPYPVDFKVTGGFDWFSWDNVTNARRLVFEIVGLAAYRLAGFSS